MLKLTAQFPWCCHAKFIPDIIAKNIRIGNSMPKFLGPKCIELHPVAEAASVPLFPDWKVCRIMCVVVGDVL